MHVVREHVVLEHLAKLLFTNNSSSTQDDHAPTQTQHSKSRLSDVPSASDEEPFSGIPEITLRNFKDMKKTKQLSTRLILAQSEQDLLDIKGPLPPGACLTSKFFPTLGQYKLCVKYAPVTFFTIPLLNMDWIDRNLVHDDHWVETATASLKSHVRSSPAWGPLNHCPLRMGNKNITRGNSTAGQYGVFHFTFPVLTLTVRPRANYMPRQLTFASD